MGQCFIKGKSLIFISSNKTGFENGFFLGNAFKAAGKAGNVFNGLLIAAVGSILISINCFTLSNVFLKIN